MYFSLFNSLPKKKRNISTKRKLAVNPMILLLFTGMCLKSWQNYTKWFKDLEKDDYQLKRHMNSNDEKYDYRQQYSSGSSNSNSSDDSSNSNTERFYNESELSSDQFNEDESEFDDDEEEEEEDDEDQEEEDQNQKQQLNSDEEEEEKKQGLEEKQPMLGQQEISSKENI